MGALSTASVSGVASRGRCRGCGEWYPLPPPPSSHWTWIDRFYWTAVAKCEGCARHLAVATVRRFTEDEWRELMRAGETPIRGVPKPRVERESETDAS